MFPDDAIVVLVTADKGWVRSATVIRLDLSVYEGVWSSRLENILMTTKTSGSVKVGVNQVINKRTVVIGQGFSSKVFSGTFDDKEVAIKRVDLDETKSKELEYLRELQHENIVRYLYKDIDDEFLYIVLEKCELSLQEFIKKEEWKDVTISSLDIFRQTANGLSYLHEKDIIHRDLKPSNTLLLPRDGKWVVRIADFGISKKLPQNRTRVTQTSVKGTVGNTAPELLRSEKISKKSDIFSLGIIYYFTLSNGEHPFGSDMLLIEAHIRDRKTPTMEHLDEKCPARSLILLMIADDQNERLDINQVQAHHLFWNDEKSLRFIQEVSDYYLTHFDVVSKSLEENSQVVIGSSWREKVYETSPIVKETIEEMRYKKQKDDIMSLLRTIRNLKHHFGEKPQEFKSKMDDTACGMFRFFTSQFPNLITHTYEGMKLYSENAAFKEFYYLRETVTPTKNLSPFNEAAIKQECKESAMEVDVTSQINPVLHDDEMKEIEHTPTENSSPNFTQSMSIESITEPAMEVDENSPKDLVLRNYQWELAEQALTGRNSLIVAPTGSGKTVVLTEVIRQHIAKSENANSHVVFMVPKTALAHQQFKFLKRHLSCSVDYIIGENVDSAPAGQKILEKRVTVLTPQILINELKRPKEESYLGFIDISMLVFDECHHTTKKHPYKEIMDLFLDTQNSLPKTFLTQIVGVTASPGVGKAKDRIKVRENLLTLLANLNIVSIPSTVEKNLDELSKHQNEIKECFIEVETETHFKKEIEMVMTELEQSVKEIFSRDSENYSDKIPSDKSKQSYEKWADDLMEHARTCTSNQENARLLITYAKHLRMYHRLLQLKDLVPNAMKHTNKLVTFQAVGFHNVKLNETNKVLGEKSVDVKVPMLEKLFDVIRKEFEKNANARCIIFVKTRLTAMSLQECIAENSDLAQLQPLFMTGKHASDASEATTQVGQDNVLEQFRVGKSKVLIATSVAEEGLHNEKCNLVIMYFHATGEVGRTQRKGRGRAADSRAILITSVDSGHIRQEENNRICAEASKTAIKDLKNSSTAELEEEVLKIQKLQITRRKQKARLGAIDATKDIDPTSRWEILCGDCGNFLTTGDKLRHIENMHTVIKDDGFLLRVNREEVAQQKTSKIRGTGNFHCNNPKCGIKVALEMVYGRMSYPTLSIKKIKLRKDDGTMMVPKKKTNFPFDINIGIDEPDEIVQEETETYSEGGPLDQNQVLELLELMANDD